jgi:uncharacterized membrane protein
MVASVFIAKLLGPVFAIFGIALLIKAQMFRAILQEFIRSAALIYMAGFFGLLGGMALVVTHNVWVVGWPLIITLIGWITLVRAVITMFQPQWIVATGSKILERRGIFPGAALANLVIGLVLTYNGYA